MTRTVREPFLCSNYKSIQSKIESYCEACKIKFNVAIEDHSKRHINQIKPFHSTIMDLPIDKLENHINNI